MSVDFRLKRTLMQIWKSTKIFDFIWKQYVEDFTLKHLLRFEIRTRKNMLKISLLFKKFTNFTGITREFSGLRMWNCQGIIFISTQTYREIFKSALVYL